MARLKRREAWLVASLLVVTGTAYAESRLVDAVKNVESHGSRAAETARRRKCT